MAGHDISGTGSSSPAAVPERSRVLKCGDAAEVLILNVNCVFINVTSAGTKSYLRRGYWAFTHIKEVCHFI